MADIKDRLHALLATKGVMLGADWQRQAAELQERRAAGEFEINQVVPGDVIQAGDDAGFYLVRHDFPLDTQHGRVPLAAALEVLPEHVALAACDPELDEFDSNRALFIDAETTGLAGGTGTVAFLVGIGYFTEDAFRLEQCFMRDYDDEEPMLEYLGKRFREYDAVVTYNGKSFDVPLIRTRFIQNRIPFPLDDAVHLDLVHAARRFWRRRLQDCSLGNIERAVLGVERHGDVPGYEIPERWFDYLHSRDARPLEGVFYHHRMDILSLAALTAWVARCVDAEGGGFEHTQDKLSLIRVHFLRRQYALVIQHAQPLLESEADDVIRRECLEYMGFAHKRLHQWAPMQEAWEMLARESRGSILARLELAKHHEHRTRDLLEAERVCAEALQFLETRESLGFGDEVSQAPQVEVFRRRLHRIQRKLGKSMPGCGPE